MISLSYRVLPTPVLMSSPVLYMCGSCQQYDKYRCEQRMKPRNEALSGLVKKKKNKKNSARAKECKRVSSRKTAGWEREAEQEGARLGKRGGEGLALLKDRKGQIANNKTERQERGEGGRREKREGKYVERRSERMEEGTCARSAAPLAVTSALQRFFFTPSSFIYSPLFFSPA